MDEFHPFVVHENDVPHECWGDDGPGAVSWKTLLSGDRTPTEAMTLGVTEIQPGDPDRMYLHRHEHAETYYFLKGQGKVVVSGIEHDVDAGAVVFVPSNAVHSVRNTGNEVLRLLYVFAADSFSEVEYVFEGDHPEVAAQTQD